MRTDDARAPGSAARRAILVCLSATLAIFVSAVVCLLLQSVVPATGGPAFVLFPYDGEVVAIGVVGGAFPLLLCAMLVTTMTTVERMERHPAPFAGATFFSGVIIVAIFITLLFSASHELYGGLGLPKLWAFWLVLGGGVAGMGYWWLRGMRLGAGEGTAECYVIGTLGVFVSDVVRTLSGVARAPGGAAVWGGGGFLDILFWFGLYMALAFLNLRIFLALLTKVSDGVLRTGTSSPQGVKVE